MDLTELLQQAQRLSNETQMDTEMPRVDRTLSQVLQSAEELHSRVTQAGTNDLQAHILLGSKGVDLLKLTQKLESLNARHSFEPLNPISDSDVGGYLKNERENVIIALIEETNLNIFKSVEKHKMRCMFAEWGEEKERLLNALVGPNQDDFPEVERRKVATILPESARPTLRLNRIEIMYAEQIQAYNNVHSHGAQKPNLLTQFTSLIKDNINIFDDLVCDMWSVLSYMASVIPISCSVDPIKSRQKGSPYVQQAITYLEKRYRQYMDTVIKKNRLVGMRGGIPNVYNTVYSYVTITFQNPQTIVGLLDMSDGRPLWPLVYYSLRSGDLNAAIQFLKESGVCPDLLKLMQHRYEGTKQQQNLELQMDDQIVQKIRLDYKNKLRVCTDPFKKAVYALLLVCDPHEPHQEVVRTIDDFLWMQLSMLSSKDGLDYNIERLTYGGLQSLILEKYGENYFNAWENAPLYFQVLVLTGQFEAALEFLARTDANRPHAVHMAIALNELNMLGTPSDMQKPLLSTDPSDPPPMRRLNLGRLILMYTKCFEQTDTLEAVHYYYLLRNFKATDGRNLMMACFIDMLVENCNEAMLELVFGKPHPNDPLRYVGGIFSQLPKMDHDKYILAGMVGDELSKRTRYEAAIRLYFIGGQLDMALSLLCSLLSQVVHQPPKEGSLREQLVDMLEHMDQCLNRRRVDVNSHTLRTYKMLSQLMKFFDYYHTRESRMAVEILTINRIIPNTYAEVDECLTNLKMVGSDIIKVLPDVMLAAMDLIYEQYTELKSGPGCTKNANACPLTANEETATQLGDAKDELIYHLRQRAKALTNFAATMPYRMPVDTNNRLVQLEILMH